MLPSEAQEIIDNIQCMDYNFTIVNKDDHSYLQAWYNEKDIDTGIEEVQKTRKWLLSKHMVKGEIVQTALKCVLTSLEHRAREHFKYKGELIFCPHFDIDAFVELAKAKRLEVRSEPQDIGHICDGNRGHCSQDCK